MIKKLFATALFGGVGYGLIEIAWRGYTHYSMMIAGALLLPMILSLPRLKGGAVFRVFCGGITITAVEFLAGVLLNVFLAQNVWDYSGEPANFMGQVCLEYTLYWMILTCVILIGREFITFLRTLAATPNHRN